MHTIKESLVDSGVSLSSCPMTVYRPSTSNFDKSSVTLIADQSPEEIVAALPAQITAPLKPPRGLQAPASAILSIIFDYALNKFDDTKDRLLAGAPKFLSVIDYHLEKRAVLPMCLPAFPFKSANKVSKVLGSLPDKAEELALDRLNSMCVRIATLYPPGAKVTIVSDGVAYNDLLCISDRDTWAYGEALRAMAKKKGYIHLEFARMEDLLDMKLPGKLKEITYVANCTNFRRLLLNTHGRANLDIDHEIATYEDTKMTYCGYKRFLESDLKHLFPRGNDRSGHSYKKDVKYLARQMLIRGDAFGRAIKAAFPKHLRLSIHQSTGEHKISMSLLDTKTGYTTPWHCSVALLSDGQWLSATKASFEEDDRFNLVYEDGRPSYYAEESARGVSELDNNGTPAQSMSLTKTCEDSPVQVAPATVELGSASDATLVTTQDLEAQLNAAPNYGRRLIPQIMDSLASTNPHRVVCSIAIVDGEDLGLRPVSARNFADAVNKTAWWLHRLIGRPSSISTVAYIGPHDIRYILLTYACVKAGWAALFLSPKNSIEGTLAVLEATHCNIWVQPTDADMSASVHAVLQQRSMNVLSLPTVDELLDSENIDAFPYEKTFEDAMTDPFCYLHTSGTTGVPKPIPWSHGLIGTMDAVRLLPPEEGDGGLLPWNTDWKASDRIYSSFPMSHGAGIIMDILMPALFNLHLVLGPRTIPASLHLVELMAKHCRIDIWSMVPSLVDELGESPDVLSKLKSSKFICASGGPVSPVSAGKVNEVIRVLNLTGTTEGLFIGNLVVPREDWRWFAFHPFSGFEFREVEPGTYEHWVHRNERWPLFQGIFHTFPDKDSINLKDLYVKHPTKPNLWAFKGRSDDLVVLSNGYKITPLETEAFVTTHPAINGCLLIGSGKPQAALLIELQGSVVKTDELLDSIWAIVVQANQLSRHQNQLLRDFITFAEPDKPFFRTDKGTVKRAATLQLYADYIERFYSSRDDNVTTTSIDVTSPDRIQESIRTTLTALLPAIKNAGLDDDLFLMGLDSLCVFAAIKTLKAATGLSDLLAPRHLYANPTLRRFSKIIFSLLADKMTNDKSAQAPDPVQQPNVINDLLLKHQQRQTIKLNAFDYVNPNHYMGLVLYLPLLDGISFNQVYEVLQSGLNMTLALIPGLSGKMMNASEQEIGYVKGDLCVTIPPLSSSAASEDRLIYKDLSQTLPHFDELRDAGFVPSAFDDATVLPDNAFPSLPADVLVAQANLVRGGCILAVNLNHCCLDGVGVMVFLRAWAENCRFLQGDQSAACSWYDPQSFNHSLPEVLSDVEGYARPAEDVDPGTWGFLPFVLRDQDANKNAAGSNAESSQHLERTRALPSPPKFKLHEVWPLPPAERTMSTTLFEISASKLEQLKSEVIADPASEGINTSISDIVQALFWRSAIKARYRVAIELRGETFDTEDISILELPTDGRPYFSSSLPDTYMGSMLIMNRCSMPLDKLCSQDTSIASVARLLRESSSRVTPQLVHDAFTLLRSLPDHSRFSTANMGLSHMHAMISNMMLFQPADIAFGDKLFANNGTPSALRPQLQRGNGRFRFLVIFPMKQDGGVELVLGTLPEELEMLRDDAELMRFARLVDVSPWT